MRALLFAALSTVSLASPYFRTINRLVNCPNLDVYWVSSGTPVKFPTSLAAAQSTNDYTAASAGAIPLDFRNASTTTSVVSSLVPLQDYAISLALLYGNCSSPTAGPASTVLFTPINSKPDANKCWVRFVHLTAGADAVKVKVFSGTNTSGDPIGSADLSGGGTYSAFAQYPMGQLTLGLYDSTGATSWSVTHLLACNDRSVETIAIIPTNTLLSGGVSFLPIDDELGGTPMAPPPAPANGAASYFNVINLLEGTASTITAVKGKYPVFAPIDIENNFYTAGVSGFFKPMSSTAEVTIWADDLWKTFWFQANQSRLVFITGDTTLGAPVGAGFAESITNPGATAAAGSCGYRVFHGSIGLGAVDVWAGNDTAAGTKVVTAVPYNGAAPADGAYFAVPAGDYVLRVTLGDGTSVLNISATCTDGDLATAALSGKYNASRANSVLVKWVGSSIASNKLLNPPAGSPPPPPAPAPGPTPPGPSPAPTPPTPPVPKKACFSGAMMVTLVARDGTRRSVPLSTLRVGDNIESVSSSGAVTVDAVFRITEHAAGVANTFVAVTTATGNVVEMTPNHYMHVGSLDLEHLTLAADVKVGDAVFVVRDGAVVRTTVTKIEQVTRVGFYNAHTVSGHIVANGVVSTHFTAESTWHHRSVAPMWYWALSQMPVALRRMIGDVVDVRL